MGNVLTMHKCGAGAAKDMVGLQLGPHRFLMYYQTAFKIAAGVLMSAKHAATYEGVHPSYWSDKLNKQQQVPMTILSAAYRRSPALPNFTDWKVGFENNLVVFTFDNETIRMHYEGALEIYGEIRLAGKNAKRWAGDTSRQWTTRAVLRDAEDNDKLVYAP